VCSEDKLLSWFDGSEQLDVMHRNARNIVNWHRNGNGIVAHYEATGGVHAITVIV